MNQPLITSMKSPDDQEEEVSVLDLAIVLAKFKKSILGTTLAVGVVAALISLAIPNEYVAVTRLLPPQQQQSGAAALLSQLGGISAAAAGVAGLKNPNDLYIGMLNSRTVADQIIARFDLKKVYDLDSMDRTRKKLVSNTSITNSRDGLITIEVQDRDKQRVARMANGYVEELVRLTKTLALTEAAQRRVFYERQLELAKNNLANAEMKLKSAIDTRGLVSVDMESRSVVETVAKMRAQIAAKEIQLNSMQAFVTADNQAYRQVQEELSSLRAQLSKLENGRSAPVDAAPDTNRAQGLENIRILRDVKYYQMLYELLAKQYEVARLDEAKDSAIIQVLDPAIEPERKSKPRRVIIVLISMALGLMGAIGYALIREAREKAMLNPKNAAKWDMLKSYLRKS
jgi:uncharacterized protein involved in exopolysaccharide biosynthesis